MVAENSFADIPCLVTGLGWKDRIILQEITIPIVDPKLCRDENIIDKKRSYDKFCTIGNSDFGFEDVSYISNI